MKASITGHPFERSIARFVDAVGAADPAGVFCTPADALTTLACKRSLLEAGRPVELSEIVGR